MADRIIKSDSGNDTVIQNNSGSSKIEVNHDGTIVFTGTSTDLIPSGTKMIFHQTAAPTGWTKVTSSNDVALRVVSGTVGSGGSVAFETAFASQTIPVHTLTVSQIPAHAHEIRYHTFKEGTTGSYSIATSETGAGAFDSANTGGGGSHGHGSINLDVSYVDVIIATKD